MNQPVSPCSRGEAPVNEVVMALAVVEGNTALIAPRRRRSIAPPAPSERRKRSPSPSTMTKTMLAAARSSCGGSAASGACRGLPPPASTIEATRLRNPLPE